MGEGERAVAINFLSPCRLPVDFFSISRQLRPEWTSSGAGLVLYWCPIGWLVKRLAAPQAAHAHVVGKLPEKWLNQSYRLIQKYPDEARVICESWEEGKRREKGCH